ncbi:MAG: pyruvate kinase [Oscillospiraceae bacterium]|nr:pyruvate kinase [Oscillospiraceae bacterium]MBQ6404206.1 pyruvate kinase [Oscillospiraceae bacterium]
MRKTKIICTIGPASESPEVFRRMCLEGLNVARLNFSHGTHEEHQKKIDMIKAVREELNLPIAIMLDTKGPEYRIRTFQGGKVTLRDGAPFTFTTRDVEGSASIVSVSYAGLADDLEPGDRVLVNNGLVIFEVERIEGTEIRCRVLTGGVLSDRKSMSFPGKVLHQTFLSEQDKSDLLFGIQNGVDFVAASFVSCKQDLLDMKAFLDANGGGDIGVIAKIENQSGVDNIEEICTVCEGIMVARGDLGVEVPFTELPAIQKHLITKCRMLGKRVITATEMLESMITNPRPTRAEISDVANAVYDGTSAIMLSGESAAGKYPVEALRVMGEIAEETENHIDYIGQFRTRDFVIRNRVDAISHAACTMAIDLDAKAIVVTSLSGLTVRMVSRFRAPITILGLATGKRAWYKLAMSWGVLPLLTEQFPNMEVLNYYALRAAKDALQLHEGDTVVMTGGDTSGASGNTNVIRIEQI